MFGIIFACLNALLISSSCALKSDSVFVNATDNSIHRSGRFMVFQNGSVQADWAASQLAFATTANSIIMHARSTAPPGGYGDMYNIYINSILASRVQLHQGVVEYPIMVLGASMAKSSSLVQVVKSTEPDWNSGNSTFRAPLIDGFTLFGGSLAHPTIASSLYRNAMSIQDISLYPVKPPPFSSTRRLLFVGDSLTAGYVTTLSHRLASSVHVPCRYGDLGFNGCVSLPNNQDWGVTWGARVCSATGAECQVLAWSGHGLVRNVMGQQPATRMPTRVQYVLSAEVLREHCDVTN